MSELAAVAEVSEVMPPEPKLVVLYSTQYRLWGHACHNHISLMRHIAGSEHNCLLGIHYWNNNTPDLPPQQIQELQYKHTHTDQETQYPQYLVLESMIKSTSAALENAKELYREIYKKEMPDDQLILRLRPDAFIYDIPNFPTKVPFGNFYLSLWNTRHRGYRLNAYEAGDVIALTTRRAMEAFTQSDLAQLDTIFQDSISRGIHAYFNEQYLHVLLKHLGIKIIPYPLLKIGLVREDGVHYLTM